MSVDPDSPRGLPLGRFVVVLLLVGLDLWTKSWAFAWLPEAESVARDPHGHLRHTVLDPWLGIMLSCNPGAAFGRLGDWPYLLVGGRTIAIAVLTWIVWRADRRQRWTFVAMLLVLAGAAGNLADNLGLGCYEEEHPFHLVRDFLDVWFLSERFGWDWHFPTFNVADSCITVGAFVWILAGFFEHDRGSDEEELAPSSEVDAG